MHPLTELKQLLLQASLKKRRGIVTRTTESHIYVTLSKGVTKVVARNDATDYKPGDTIMLLGDTLLGRTGRNKTSRIYEV